MVEEDWLVCQEHVLDNYFIPRRHMVWRHNESKMSKNKQFPTISSFLFLANEQLNWKHFPSFSFSPISRIRGWVFHWEERNWVLQHSLQLRQYIHLCTVFKFSMYFSNFTECKAIFLSNIHYQIWYCSSIWPNSTGFLLLTDFRVKCVTPCHYLQNTENDHVLFCRCIFDERLLSVPLKNKLFFPATASQ